MSCFFGVAVLLNMHTKGLRCLSGPSLQRHEASTTATVHDLRPYEMHLWDGWLRTIPATSHLLLCTSVVPCTLGVALLQAAS